MKEHEFVKRAIKQTSWERKQERKHTPGNSLRFAKRVEDRKKELDAEGDWEILRVDFMGKKTQCEFCHTWLKNVFHIALNGHELGVGCECVKYFSSLDAEIEKILRAIRKRRTRIESVFKEEKLQAYLIANRDRLKALGILNYVRSDFLYYSDLDAVRRRINEKTGDFKSWNYTDEEKALRDAVISFTYEGKKFNWDQEIPKVGRRRYLLLYEEDIKKELERIERQEEYQKKAEVGRKAWGEKEGKVREYSGSNTFVINVRDRLRGNRWTSSGTVESALHVVECEEKMSNNGAFLHKMGDTVGNIQVKVEKVIHKLGEFGSYVTLILYGPFKRPLLVSVSEGKAKGINTGDSIVVGGTVSGLADDIIVLKKVVLRNVSKEV